MDLALRMKYLLKEDHEAFILEGMALLRKSMVLGDMKTCGGIRTTVSNGSTDRSPSLQRSSQP